MSLKKLLDFFDSDMLQLFVIELQLFVIELQLFVIELRPYRANDSI
jgi:hypothetical protein